ncbi:CRISPR-associated endonuclease Cas2 [Thermodesulfobacteriota bacterium B35]
MRRRPAVIAYDISRNRRRRRIFRILKQWRLDAQYSVFECRLTRAEAEELFLQLTGHLDPDTDFLLLAWLDSGRKAVGLTRCARPGFRVPVWYVG